MPAKGWKKPKEAPARCPSCSKLLPAAMLKGFVSQLQRLQIDLVSMGAPPDDEVAIRRAAQLAVLHARSTAEILTSDYEHMLCEGHEPKKRKPEPSADPSEPPGIERTARRKKGARAPLRAVSDDHSA